mmetsp:Transcript_10099/g.28230  ORF Transcript_10099/g.28230 Transcript_10099/m.28230 type:complete len:231 (-) Transcript_10099:123-815(-)
MAVAVRLAVLAPWISQRWAAGDRRTALLRRRRQRRRRPRRRRRCGAKQRARATQRGTLRSPAVRSPTVVMGAGLAWHGRCICAAAPTDLGGWQSGARRGLLRGLRCWVLRVTQAKAVGRASRPAPTMQASARSQPLAAQTQRRRIGQRLSRGAQGHLRPRSRILPHGRRPSSCGADRASRPRTSGSRTRAAPSQGHLRWEGCARSGRVPSWVNPSCKVGGNPRMYVLELL